MNRITDKFSRKIYADGGGSGKKKYDSAEDEKQLNEQLRRMHLDYIEKERNRRPPGIAEQLPEDPGYTFREYDAPTDEELRSAAEERYLPVLEAEKSKMQTAADEKKGTLDQELTDAKAALEAAKKKIAASLRKAGNDIENDMIARGLSRSSIRRLAGERAKDGANAERRRAYGVFYGKEKEHDREVRAVNDKLGADVSAAEAEYMRKIGETAEKLAEKRSREQKYTAEYNDRIRKEIAEYTKKRDELIKREAEERKKAERELEEWESEHGYSGEKRDEYAERLALARAFYDTLPPEEALEMVRNNSYLKNYLGLMYSDLLAAYYSAALGK